MPVLDLAKQHACGDRELAITALQRCCQHFTKTLSITRMIPQVVSRPSGNR